MAELKTAEKGMDASKQMEMDQDREGRSLPIGWKEIEELGPAEAAHISLNEFPDKYRYLLSLPCVNEKELNKHPKLCDLVFNKQRTVSKIIKKQAAIVCLYWAQAINRCLAPLLEKVTLKLASTFRYKSKKDPKKYFRRILFEISRNEGTKGPEDRSMSNGMAVFVKGSNGNHFLARVMYAESGSYRISVRVPGEKTSLIVAHNQTKVDIFEVPQEFIPVSMLETIKYMKSGLLNQAVIPKPEFEEPHESYLTRRDREKHDFAQTYQIPQVLTPSQLDAVYTICTKQHKGCPFVLFGPPGTGKTYTISHTIQTILKMDPRNRVLVCTPSNIAADRVAEQLMENFGSVLTKNNVLRLKAPGNNFFARYKRFDDISSFDPDAELFTIPETFDRWRVVVCTLGCSSHLIKDGLLRGFFSHIFIDEAGQSSEGEIWLSLSLATPETSIILCGDPRQLGPVIPLDISRTLQESFTSPLFRYMRMKAYRTDTRLSIQLVDCFRCPIALTCIVSFLFYGGTLMHTKRHRPAYDLSDLGLSEKFPVLFVSVNGQEEQKPGGFSFCNHTEAKIVVEYLNFLVGEKEIRPESIGVISPYTYQSKIIIEHMKNCGNRDRFDKVAVDSVERFQGSERDVIIITGTRTLDLGFMADDLRVNTSLTRAKNFLIVIGNENALQNHASWRRFILYCKKIERFRSWYPGDTPFHRSNH